MNIKARRCIEILKLRARLFRKKLEVNKLSKRAGGKELRDQTRKARQEAIRNEKSRIVSSLVSSWGLGEIPAPTEDEKRAFWLYPNTLSMENLVRIQKKYWTWAYIICPNSQKDLKKCTLRRHFFFMLPSSVTVVSVPEAGQWLLPPDYFFPEIEIFPR